MCTSRGRSNEAGMSPLSDTHRKFVTSVSALVIVEAVEIYVISVLLLQLTIFPLSILISIVVVVIVDDDDVVRLGGLSTMCETAGGEPTDQRCCRRPPLGRRLWVLAACRSPLSALCRLHGLLAA
uniref:Transmembrane protein n=1 Tax=Angiostrongylus cantonensis TaxID=6313 RepID=A0A0K0CSQ9_ANGCA